jgi:uncharacterized protein YjbI with pentapeptide repeats
MHDGNSLGNDHRAAFLHRVGVRPRLVDDNGVPAAGFWALRPDDPTGQKRLGRLRALPPPRVFDSFLYPSAEPIVADFANTQIDASALFNFENLGGNAPLGAVPFILLNRHPLDLTVDLLNIPSATFIANFDGLDPNNKFGFDPLQILELGNQKVQLQARTSLFQRGIYSSFFIDTDGTVKWYSKPQSIPFMSVLVLFRFFPDGEDPSYPISLQEGEVALYQQCNYQGKVAVVGVDTPDLSALSTPDTTLDRTTASIKLGPNTGVLLYADAGFTGTELLITSNTTCLDGTPIGRGTRSLRTEPLLPIFLASSSCVNCNLSGVNLTGKVVTGANLQGASLAGANLTHTVLHDARSLAGTDLRERSWPARICRAVGKAGGPDPHDFRLVPQRGEGLLLPGQLLQHPPLGYQSPYASNWRYLDPTQALIDLDPSGVWPVMLDLSRSKLDGASLQNGNYLLGVILTDATLAGANLTGAALRDIYNTPRFDGAKLDGVIGLNGTDLTGANFSGASLQCLPLDGGTQRCVNLSGVTLTGAHFDQAKLIGADLSGTALQGISWQGAVLDHVAGLAGADLRGVVFNGTSLNHVDFTGAKMDGTQLVGAHLQGAILRTVTGLPTANLTGADLTGAHLEGAVLIQASLEEATLDGVTGLAGANLAGIRFNGSSLGGVDLSTAKLFGRTSPMPISPTPACTGPPCPTTPPEARRSRRPPTSPVRT